ncbi:Ribonuclease H [Alphaproteobacteria bacterium]
MEEAIIKIYCDGACSNNPGVGGWGAVLLWKSEVKRIYGYDKYTTNNRMEIVAAIEALKAVKKRVRVAIYTDSMYLKNGITSWIAAWKVNRWKNGKIKNIDLWKKLDELVEKYEVEWHWVKGHDGNMYNELADKLAKAAIKEFNAKGVELDGEEY